MELVKAKKTQLLCLVALISGVATGCSQVTPTTGQTDSPGTVSSLSSGNGELSMNPTDAKLYVRGTYSFSATGGVEPYHYFLVTGEGSINEFSGVYTAPANAGNAIVVVEDSEGEDAYANVTVQGIDLNLTLSPSTATVNEGGTYQFSTSGGTAPYTYEVISGVGSINTKTGLYTAPQSTGSASIEVTDAQNEKSYASVTVIDPSTGSLPPITLYREYDSSTGFHMSTTTSGEDTPAYSVEETLLDVFGSQSSSSIVPLYRCSVGNIRFSTTSSTCEDVPGAELETQLGWIDSNQQNGEIPLYRLHSSSTGDCIDSLSSTEGAQNGYVLDGVLGYGLPAN